MQIPVTPLGEAGSLRGLSLGLELSDYRYLLCESCAVSEEKLSTAGGSVSSVRACLSVFVCVCVSECVLVKCVCPHARERERERERERVRLEPWKCCVDTLFSPGMLQL